ncbi:MAG: trypsin-like peptidase domain-containing protein [Coriobacteriales bacterium]|nr:trypsin-like peptidase domain-containing protein [Coriobacteriales bacterium]MBQ6587008.1 trypsin-like peptidase domain-containing protein [Coriobacteriales bacterium]
MYGYGYGYGYGPYGYGGQDNGQEYDEDDLVYFGLGSGVILSSDGYILTNYHVIEDSQKIIVNVDEDEYEAKVIGYDESSDLAVIKIEPTTALVPMEIGSSSDLAVGQWVMALGSPFGLEKSVSTGIVSALYRSTSMEGSTGLSIYTNMIQTDAAINPGNSGGALVDSQGRLIGINTLIESYSGSSSGVGFAIPVDYAMKVANAIIEGREVEHTWLGVSLGTVDYGVAHNNGLSVDAGAYVAEVVPGSPAEKAGIQKGDVIVSIEKHEIIDSSEVIIEIRSYEPGDTVTLGIVRGDQKLELQATLGSDIQANSVDIEE